VVQARIDLKIQRFVDEEIEKSKQERWGGWYWWFGHLLTTVGLSAGAATYCIAHLREWRGGSDGLAVFLLFDVANNFEWWAHKYVLHRRLRGFEILFDEHRGKHHYIYRWNDMVMRSMDEMRFVLIPARGIFGVIVANAMLSSLLGLLLGTHYGHLACAVFSLYILTYELLHLSYHSAWLDSARTKAPWRSHPVERFLYNTSWVLRKLREHHARHHDPTLMDTYNMNVSFPWTDLLMWSFAPKRLLARAREILKRLGNIWPSD